MAPEKPRCLFAGRACPVACCLTDFQAALTPLVKIFRASGESRANSTDMTSFVSEKEKRLNALLETVPNGIMVVDEVGTITLTNSEAERMFGYEPGELIGKSVEILIPPKVREYHPTLRMGFVQNPSRRKMGAGRDLSGFRKDGVEFPVEVGLNPLETETGLVVVASVVDITERKRHEQQLHDAYEEVQRRNQEMEQFVYTISHDLRSPLVATMGFVEFIKEDIEAGNFAEVNDALERIARANKRMQQLIDDLLQLSRAGRLELKLKSVDLSRLIAEVVDSASQVVKEKGVEIEIANDFPVVVVDGDRLFQVFENLFMNALKYGTSGSDSQIRFFWEDAGEEVRICIADNGQGIPEEYHRKIFGLFQRLDTSQEGTGVGLAIVTRIIDLHHGRVWVESTPGAGAAFWVALPKMPMPLQSV